VRGEVPYDYWIASEYSRPIPSPSSLDQKVEECEKVFAFPLTGLEWDDVANHPEDYQVEVVVTTCPHV
jgi:hypothetical protein